jgi:tetratricopeptide (TPR) repeat protein
MEINVPDNQRADARAMIDALFLNNLEKILQLREIEFELNEGELFDEVLENRDFYRYILEIEPKISTAFKENIYQPVLKAYHQTSEKKDYIDPDRYEDIRRITEQKLARIADRENLPLVMREISLNLLAFSLDHISSRIRAKRFVRKTGMEVFQFKVGEITSASQIDELKQMVGYLIENAREFNLLPLLESFNVIGKFLEKGDVLMADKFEGEKAVGYGPCDRCTMMFSSSAIVSLDPSCPNLIDKDETLHLPLEFNSAQCPFCGIVKRIDTPAMFYRPSNKKIIYNVPTHHQYSEAEAENLYAEMIGNIRERYRKRISHEEAVAFDNAGEEITYNILHFLTSIQMGTVNRVQHAFLQVKLAGGSSLLVDPTTNAIIDLVSPAEVAQMWDLSDDTALTEDQSLNRNIDEQAFREAKDAYNKGDYEKAEQLFMDIYRSDPDDKIAGRYLSSVYLHLGKKELAEELINTQ